MKDSAKFFLSTVDVKRVLPIFLNTFLANVFQMNFENKLINSNVQCFCDYIYQLDLLFYKQIHFGLILELLSISYNFGLKLAQQLLIYTSISLELLISCLLFQLFQAKVAIYFRYVFLILGTLRLRFLVKMDTDLMVSKNTSKYHLIISSRMRPVINSNSWF